MKMAIIEGVYKGARVAPRRKRVVIRNKGIIKYADIRLKNGLNIITGNNATGKTTVLDVIAGTRKQDKIDVLLFRFFKSMCVLIDNFVSSAHSLKMLAQPNLASLKIQLVVAVPSTLRIPLSVCTKVNIIDTEKFVLK